eukprot:TRINITY_DN34659_c0_g1_i1.p1 TRINITY_DN34659_c0_g1~~TRINITY_DN34659_c0_g1_i1.p1  ORF type:complete len:360 (+),score=37.13 TRINITY_DN34659_c0_g1_i1:81-1160(+)
MRAISSILLLVLSAVPLHAVETQDDPVRGGGSGPVVNAPGSDSFCKPSAPCPENVGDCDDDADCQGPLGCGFDNCLRLNGGPPYTAGQDCCEPRAIGHFDYCSSGGCQEGEGDCEDGECAAGLVCGVDNCRTMNPLIADKISPGADCCEKPQQGHPLYCTINKCSAGEGNCNNDMQCQPGLTCSPSHCTQGTGSCCGCAHPGGVVSDSNNALSPQTMSTVTNPPVQLAGGVMFGSTTTVAAGTELSLSCCSAGGCSFYIIVYHCPPCSVGANGGLTEALVSSGWRPGSCSPLFDGHRTVAYFKSLASGSSEAHTLSTPANFLFVVSKPAVLSDNEWCREPSFRPRGPHIVTDRSCAVCP